MNRYIVFRRTEGHCVTWLVRAGSLREALRRYALEEFAKEGENGSLVSEDGYGGQIVYEHPLACIEAEEKTMLIDSGWHGWEIRELHEAHWQADFTEVFCSEDPDAVKGYIELCRPALRRRFPRSRARAFVWYLKQGPLVTFYRAAKRGRCWPIEILGRYVVPWNEYPKVCEWAGTCEDILEQMKVEYPLPEHSIEQTG